jgi:uncharacterized protein (DUF952 family)
VTLIYKIVPSELWREAVAVGWFAGAGVDVADGFLHFSTAAQVRDTAAKHFAGLADLVLVAVDTAPIASALRWQPSRGGDLFPHLYQALPMTAVQWATPLPVGSDGRHEFPSSVAVDGGRDGDDA